MHLFSNYNEWRSAITGRCGLTLSRAYCRERLAALADPEVPSTKAFLEAYGKSYSNQVCQWFKQAENEASE